MGVYTSLLKQHTRRIFEGIVIVLGILLFALFIHKQGALLIFAFTGLLISAYTIHHASKGVALFRAFGFNKSNRLMPLYIVIALLLGVAMGIAIRNKFNLSLLPRTLTYIALLGPVIGITEELIFRGFIQGHVRPAGRIFALLFATAGHTLYKLFVIGSLSDTAAFNFQFLLIWTFIGGILFGLLREFSGSVIPSAVAHACFDIILYGGFIAAPFWVWG